jgi:type I restriction enzyme S subunit
MRLRGIGGIGGDASVRTPRVSIADLGDVKVNVPAPEEQKKLASEFSATREKTRTLLARLEEVLWLTDQLRSSIITSVVTGAFDRTSERSIE